MLFRDSIIFNQYRFTTLSRHCYFKFIFIHTSCFYIVQDVLTYLIECTLEIAWIQENAIESIKCGRSMNNYINHQKKVILPSSHGASSGPRRYSCPGTWGRPRSSGTPNSRCYKGHRSPLMLMDFLL